MSIAHAVASEAGEQVQFDHLKLAAGANDASLKEFENGESMYIWSREVLDTGKIWDCINT